MSVFSTFGLMIFAILYIRARQLTRALNSLGLGRFLVMLLIGLFAAYITFQSSNTATGSYMMLGAYLVIISSIHLKRKDTDFLKSQVPQYRKLYILEYLILALTAIISLLFHHRYIECLLLVVLLVGISYIPKPCQVFSLNTRLQDFIPASSFEWKRGIRSTLIYISIIWLAGLFISFWVGIVPLAIYSIGLITMNFIERDEPFTMLVAFESSAKRLIYDKMKMQLFLFSILVIPLMVAFLIFHTQYWYIVAIMYLVIVIIHCYSILVKYAFYEPRSSKGGQQVFVALGAISMFIPFLIPLIFVLSVRFYFKSINNLNQYLHDFN